MQQKPKDKNNKSPTQRRRSLEVETRGVEIQFNILLPIITTLIFSIWGREQQQKEDISPSQKIRYQASLESSKHKNKSWKSRKLK